MPYDGDVSRREGLERFTTMRNLYNAVYREEEREMLPSASVRASASSRSAPRCAAISRDPASRSFSGSDPVLCYRWNRTTSMGTDGLVELDQECWVALAKYNLLLATGFGTFAVITRATMADNTLLLIENGALALLFGAVQTYAWLSAG